MCEIMRTCWKVKTERNVCKLAMKSVSDIDLCRYEISFVNHFHISLILSESRKYVSSLFSISIWKYTSGCVLKKRLYPQVFENTCRPQMWPVPSILRLRSWEKQEMKKPPETTCYCCLCMWREEEEKKRRKKEKKKRRRLFCVYFCYWSCIKPIQKKAYLWRRLWSCW